MKGEVSVNAKKKLLIRWLLVTLITGILVFAVVGGYCISEDLDYARGNEYAREHLAERIAFSLSHSALFVTLMSLLFVQIPFWLTELIGRHRSAEKDKKFTRHQLIATPIIAAAVFIGILVLWILAHFTFTV